MSTLETFQSQPRRSRLRAPIETLARRRRHHERQLVRFIVLSDVVVLAATAAVALVLTGGPRSTGGFIMSGLLIVGLVLLSFSFYRLYERDRQQIAVSTLDEVRDFVNALTLVGFIVLFAGQAFELDELRPTTVLLFWLICLAVLPLSRGLFRHVVVPLLQTPQSTVIIGAGEVGQSLAHKIRKHPEYNLRLVGFLDDDPHPLDQSLEEFPVLGSEDDLIGTIRRYSVSRVILAFSRRPPDSVLQLIRDAGLREVHLSIVPRYFEIMTANAGVADVDGMPVIDLPPARLSRLARATKHAFDLGLTLLALILLAPLFLLAAIAIKLDSPGPVFFRQLRMGQGERVFRIFKFRTMVDGAESFRDGLLGANESSGPLFKIRSDPRVTRVGRLLRRLSLDELPQLLNILKGEMSLVGPRPFVVHEDEKINGWARRRLDLTPGITGLWQVLGRNDIDFEEMVRLDYLYVNNWSLWWDIKLLIRTVPIVLKRNGY